MQDLSPAVQKFILHWGEMGNRWGINRTVAQVHALLYISQAPLNAEQITDLLGVARSNVSTSIRELQNWGVVKTVHVMGDRRDHFTSVKEVWELFEIILDERKKREIDPTLTLLRECQAEAQKQNELHVEKQLAELLYFFETMDAWYEQMRKMPRTLRTTFFKMGDKIQKLLN